MGPGVSSQEESLEVGWKRTRTGWKLRPSASVTMSHTKHLQRGKAVLHFPPHHVQSSLPVNFNSELYRERALGKVVHLIQVDKYKLPHLRKRHRRGQKALLELRDDQDRRSKCKAPEVLRLVCGVYELLANLLKRRIPCPCLLRV